MNSETIVKISVFITLLSLVYYIADYFGWVRCCSLKMKKSVKIPDNYMSLDKAHTFRVVVVFYYDGDSDKYIQFMNSILDQTVRVNEIAVCCKDGVKIPQELEKIVNVYRFNGNIKAEKEAMMMMMSIMREPDEKTKLLFLSPKVIYGQDFIERMTDTPPDKIIYGDKDKSIDGGILMSPSHVSVKLSNDFSDYVSEQKEINVDEFIKKYGTTDDIVIEYKENF